MKLCGVDLVKKNILLIVSILLILALNACGSITTQPAGQTASEQNPIEGAPTEELDPGQNPGGTMPLAMRLIMGILKLEETDTPITPEQAAELLPLWKALRSLSESDTTAAEELEALVNQIADGLTPEQTDAIEAMELSMEDMRAIAEEMGIEFGGAGRFGDLTPEMQATMEAARQSGQFPEGSFGGGIPDPGGGPGAGGEPGAGGVGGDGLSPEARQTAIAERGEARGANLGLNPALLEAIIEFLQAKAP
jgi:hypothetical protein